MNNKDYYDILGVSKNASDDEIKSAFRKLAKEYHPDRSKHDNAEEKFKEIGEAYAVLSDPQKRKNYDNFGTSEGFQGGGFGGFDPGDIDLEDILRQAFGGGFGGFSGFSGFNNFGGGNRSYKGEDVIVRVNLTFEESFYGKEEILNIKLKETCTKCDGEGGFKPRTCDTCGGHGRVVQNIGFFQTETTCPTCEGTGKTYTEICSKCQGSTYEEKQNKIKLNIPSGVDNDTKLRLRNRGNAGINGGPNGDLYVTFNVKKHPIFERINDDLYLEVPVTVTEAVLGAKKDIPTMDGKVRLTIKPGTQNYTKLKLKDKGFKRGNNKPGDMYAVVNIIIPRKLSKKEKDLFLKLSKENLDKDEEFVYFNKHI